MSDEPMSPVSFPLQHHLGFEVVAEVEGPGTAAAHLTIDERHHNPNGVVHGSVSHALMDTAMGAATMSVLDDTKICATIEMQVRYHRPAMVGELRATAKVLQAGKRIVHLEGRTVDSDGRLIASSTSSYAVIDT